MRRFLAVLSVVCGLAACNSNAPAAASTPTSTLPTTPSAIQMTGVPSTNDTGTVLFQDDFSNKNGNWDQQSSNEGASNYGSGFYTIQVKSADYSIWANPNSQPAFGDVVIEVDAATANGPEDAAFGAICRYSDVSNFMYVTVAGDGYYGIVLVKDAKATVLTGQGSLMKSNAINTGKINNHIQFVCQGDEYALFVNGQKLDSIKDSTFTRGSVGLIATTFAAGGAEVHFNKYLVTTP
jgi:hypothetical protein